MPHLKLLSGLIALGLLSSLGVARASILITDFTSAGTGFSVFDEVPGGFTTQLANGLKIQGTDAIGNYFQAGFDPQTLSSLGTASSITLSLTADPLTTMTASSPLYISLFTDMGGTNYATWKGSWPTVAGNPVTLNYFSSTGAPDLSNVLGTQFNFEGTGSGNLNLVLNNLSASAVPEPSNFLILASLGFVGLLRRRVRRSSLKV